MADITGRNHDACNAIIAANKMFNTTTHGFGSYDKTKLLTIAHISDLHVDQTRYANFLQFAKGFSAIDHAIVSGDIVDSPTTNQYNYMYTQETNAEFSPIKVVGNHEKYGSGTYMNRENIYTNLHMDTATEELYYYIDDSTNKVRIIVLNQYDTDEQTYMTEHLSQDQIDWFITALKGAITNEYAVIVCMHACESGGSFPAYKAPYKSIYSYDGKSNTAFYQRFKQWENEPTLQNVCSGTPIEDIINAFKTGGSLDETYTFSDTEDSITVDDEFSTAGTFIAYMIGHNHGDYIGSSAKYSDQLYLNVCSGSPWYGNVSDLQRKDDANEKSEDAFNVYVIDQTHKLVKVIRVGSDINDIMQERKMVVYSY